jgi:hypothetical protein
MFLSPGSRITGGKGARRFAGVPAIPFGQVRLALSGSNLLLSPYQGNLLTINRRPHVIAAGGLALAPTGLTASTLYYIYATETPALEASTTGHVTDPSTGIEVKSGDPTRTLVGMAFTDGTPSWNDSATKRNVASWFNRQTKRGANKFTATRTVTSSTFVEVNSEIRIEFVVWPDEAVYYAVGGCVFPTSGAAETIATSVGFDGTTQNRSSFIFNPSTVAQQDWPIGLSAWQDGLSEGHHYATVLGKTNTSTASWGDSDADSKPSLDIQFRG